MEVAKGKPPLVLEETLASDNAESVVVVARRIATLPSPDPLCPYCITLAALPWPEYAAVKLCGEHLATARALQCKGWNAHRWHQHLAGLARHGRLMEAVEWWPSARSGGEGQGKG